MRVETERLRRFASAALAAGAAALAVISCGGTDGKMTSYSESGTSANEAQLFTVPEDQMQHVSVVTANAGPLARHLRLTGTVAYNGFRTTPVISQVGGLVSRVTAVPGQQVRAGQPLLYVSSPDFSQLRANFVKAHDVVRVSEKNYARAQDLYSHGAIAERDLLQAESDRNLARADLDASGQALRILGIQKPEELTGQPDPPEIPVLAPVAGEVVERQCEPGQLLQAGSVPCFTISDMSTVWVLVNIYQKDLQWVKVGAPVTIETDSYPTAFHGEISYVAQALDPTTRTLQARIVTQNPGAKLKKDMYVTATVEAEPIPNAVTVPDSAVLRDTENLPFVYVASGKGQFARRGVTLGSSTDGSTEILSGLKPGESVAADGSLFLQFANSLQQ
jgi:membrane fusion protein, heavy metal efflux system